MSDPAAPAGSPPAWTSGDVASPASHNVKYGGRSLQSGHRYTWTVRVTTTGGISQLSPVASFSMGILSGAGQKKREIDNNKTDNGMALQQHTTTTNPAPTGGHRGWTGQFIGMPAAAGPPPQEAVAPWFRKTFKMPTTTSTAAASGVNPAAPTSADAFLFVASIGFCEVTVNGVAASEAVLSPSISYLPSRVLYRTYDVAALLRPGKNNTIGLWASAGWADYMSFQWAVPGQFPHAPLVMAELHVANTVVAATDSTWQCRKSTTSRIGNWGDGGFGGDHVDTTLDVPGWDTPEVAALSTAQMAAEAAAAAAVGSTAGAAASTAASPAWAPAAVYRIAANITVSADTMEPTTKHSRVAAVSIDVVEAGDTGDAGGGGEGQITTATATIGAASTNDAPPLLGQNVTVTMAALYTGWFEIANLQPAAPNTTIRFYVSTTEGVASEFSMIDALTVGPNKSSASPYTFRMRFSYHEIRYITVSGLAAPPQLADVTGWRLSSSLERTGVFRSSSALMNTIYDTTVNNYLGLTTGGQTVDCPHRERRGYGGDGHTSYQFALANFGVGSYFTKWARDFADVQLPSGDVPHTAPTVSGGGGPAWSGFVVTLPWEVYRAYGDTSLLANMYPTMQRQLAFYANKTHPADGLLHAWDANKWDFLGDWITPHGSENDPTGAVEVLFNNCYLHYITTLAGRIADVLGKPDEASAYGVRSTKLAAAINAAFYDANTGAYVDQLQTHLLMPLATGVVPAAREASVVLSLEAAIAKTGGHLDTGLTGNYFMTKFFTEGGRNDLMWGITSKTTFPSYGYFLAQNYTTWPERWNVKPCCGDTVSKMHGCYNAVGMWFVQGLAGIDVDFSRQDGYAIVVRAGVDAIVVGGGGGEEGEEGEEALTWASGTRAAPQGSVYSAWSAAPGARFYHNVTVPGNSAAKVLIPGASAADVLEDGKPLPADVKVLGMETVNGVEYVALGVGAGDFAFSSSWAPQSS